MKKKLIALGVAGLFILPVAPAFAGSAGDGSGYGTQPGYDGAITNSNGCAGAGAFGALGKDASLGTEKVHADFLGSYPGPGTDGTQTGLNNSTLCGNPQN